MLHTAKLDIDSFEMETDFGEFKRIGSNERSENIENWQIAYWARELRKKNEVSLTCLKGDEGFVIEQLKSFSNSAKVTAKNQNDLNSREVYLEVSTAA